MRVWHCLVGGGAADAAAVGITVRPEPGRAEAPLSEIDHNGGELHKVIFSMT